MEDKQKELIVKKILKIAENLQAPFARGNRRTRFISREGISYSLTDEYVDLWDAILRDLLVNCSWNKKFSEKYVDLRLQELLNTIIKDESPQRAHECFDQLADEYERYSNEQNLIIPLFGIELVENQIELGKTTLKKLNDELTEELIDKLSYAISNSSNSDDEKKMHFEHEKEFIDKYLRNQVCAVLTVNAEPERALEIAETDSQRALDLLRYAIPAIYSQDKGVIIGLQGEYSRNIRYAQVFFPLIDVRLVAGLLP